MNQQERSSLLRETLIRIVGHDLRGPLSNLKSVISLTLDDQLSPEQIKRFMIQIDRGVDESVKMLDDLTEWGKASSDLKRTPYESLYIKELVDQIAEEVSHTIEQKELSYANEIDAKVKCFFDKYALRVIIRNLLTNAIKFTPRGGSITITSKESHDEVKIQVRDTGIGVPDEMKDGLFQMRKDTHRPGTENEKSSGVGLFIAQDLVLRHGASLEVQDNPAGGTIFSLTIVRDKRSSCKEE